MNRSVNETERGRSGQTTFRAADLSEAEALAGLFMRAFEDDAVLDWCMRRRRRREAICAFFHAVLIEAIPYGEVVVNDSLSACAVWIPPTASAPPAPALWQPRQLVWMLGLASPARLLRLHSLFRASVTAHPERPHYHLSFLAIDPTSQRRGLGTRLVRATLDRVDRERQCTYLETVNPANIKFYERLGFRPTGGYRLPRGGPRIHQMWREPA